MNYTVQLTDTARRDLLHNVSYVKDELLNPKAAEKLLQNTVDVLDSLSQMPQRHALVSDEMLAGIGIRMVRINAYYAFYRIHENTRTVTVLRILYERRAWQNIICGDEVNP